jgi:hypothetical protein
MSLPTEYNTSRFGELVIEQNYFASPKNAKKLDKNYFEKDWK